MKSTDLLLLGGLAVGGFFLLKSQLAVTQPFPSGGAQYIPVPMPMPSPIPLPSPAPQPTPSQTGWGDFSGLLSQITEFALNLIPTGSPTLDPVSGPLGGFSTLPPVSPFSQYDWGQGWTIFRPGEGSFGGF